jgi:SAM-dependent methyltransferase
MKLDYGKVEEFWDRQAAAAPERAGMLGVLGPAGARYRTQAEWAHLLRVVAPRPEWAVLELGCGAGRWAFLLAPRVRFIRGLDVSGRMIELAEAERARRGLANVAFERGSLPDYAPPEQYDLIYFSSLLNYLTDDDARRAVARMAAALRPGGVLLSRDTVRPAGREVREGEYPIVYRPLDEYTAPFREAGFRLSYQAESFRWPRGEGWLQRVCPPRRQERWPRLSLAALEGLDALVRLLAGMKLVRSDAAPEYRHLLMRFERE